MIRAGLTVLLCGCLPKSAALRADEAPGTRFLLEVPAGGEQISVDLQFARAFSDGSNGWLVCVGESTSNRCAELRSFPTGEVLTVRGMARLGLPLGVTAALWPLLSPAVKRQSDAATSWPIEGESWRSTRILAGGAWQREGPAWRWAPTLTVSGSGGAVSGTGTLDARVILHSGGLREAAWTFEFSMCTADAPCRELASAGRLARIGEAPPRAVAPCASADESQARAPLCLADGTVVSDPGGGGPGRVEEGTLPVEPTE